MPKLFTTNSGSRTPLPIPDVIDTSKRKHITLQVQQVDQFLGLYDEMAILF